MSNNFFVNVLDFGTTWNATSYAQAKFVKDFVAAWTKVMNLDRFELA